MDMHTALILRRMVIVLTAEELMKKKGIFKQELDAQTTKSNELWQKSTEKLSEIMKHYFHVLFCVCVHLMNSLL